MKFVLNGLCPLFHQATEQLYLLCYSPYKKFFFILNSLSRIFNGIFIKLMHTSIFVPQIDIDECAKDMDECEHMCMNTEGSYNCSCFSNYLLADNGKSCTSKY